MFVSSQLANVDLFLIKYERLSIKFCSIYRNLLQFTGTMISIKVYWEWQILHNSFHMLQSEGQPLTIGKTEHSKG